MSSNVHELEGSAQIQSNKKEPLVENCEEQRVVVRKLVSPLVLDDLFQQICTFILLLEAETYTPSLSVWARVGL